MRLTYRKYAEHPGISLLDVCEFSFNVLNFFNTLLMLKIFEKTIEDSDKQFNGALYTINTSN
ncbi:hypothetical protein B5D82_16290 [Cognaticolwellia beringensis]|uniref:Uncharacterized protein n=1 Tax=Cognaticolwellia beringensis TaxID=1967665 RepID=A0A222GBB6_9GAMM|nr:hypothetical protein B5D82_16290 [Cognaticolwellia beringensis]